MNLRAQSLVYLSFFFFYFHSSFLGRVKVAVLINSWDADIFMSEVEAKKLKRLIR